MGVLFHDQPNVPTIKVIGHKLLGCKHLNHCVRSIIMYLVTIVNRVCGHKWFTIKVTLVQKEILIKMECWPAMKYFLHKALSYLASITLHSYQKNRINNKSCHTRTTS